MSEENILNITEEPSSSREEASAPESWESQLAKRAQEMVARRLTPLQAEIDRLQGAIQEVGQKLRESSEARADEEESSGILEAVKQWFSESSARAEEQFQARLATQREEWEIATQSAREEAFQKRLEQACSESAAVARRESDMQMEELREQLEASRQALMLAISSAQTAPSPSINFELLKRGVEEIDQQRTQAETLSTLVRQAAQFAPRIVFFVVKGGAAVGWKASGFDNGLNDDTVKLLSVSTSEPSLLRDALTSFTTETLKSISPGENSAVLGLYGSPAPERAIAVPLVVRGKAAAVLYADSGTKSEAAINTPAIEMLMRVAGMGIELLPTRRGMEPIHPPTTHRTETSPLGGSAVAVAPAPVIAPSPEPAPEPEPAAEAPAETTAEAPPAAEAVAEAAEAEVEKELETRVDEMETEEGATEASADFETQEMEVPPIPRVEAEIPPPPPAPPIFAMPSAEASSAPTIPMTPLRTTRDIVPEPEPEAHEAAGEAVPEPTPEPAPEPAPIPEPVRYQPAPVSVPTPASETEQRAHNDARRFARLLVSEIKLYNAAKVNEGRKNSDLYHRLMDEIDRSRKVYDKRVSPAVATKFDYFYDELVQTLAEGDAAKLGADCPGPVVR